MKGEKKSGNFGIAMGVAFVWFTTQFGGGFASGNQLRAFFVNYGNVAFITCLIAQFMGAFYQWYALKYARKHETYDYKSFNDSFYGKYKFIFSNLYELVYLFTIGVAPAAAFATGVACMEETFHVNYWFATAFTFVFIFIVAVYGTAVVRRVASILSIAIVVGLVAIYIPNIIHFMPEIKANIAANSAHAAAGELPSTGSAIIKAIVYGSFQLGSIGLLIQHAKAFDSPDEAKTSMIFGFFVNGVICLMAVFGLMAVKAHPEFAEAKIPLNILVRTGIEPRVTLGAIINVLIILGSISTAVNMIAGFVNRVCKALDPSFDPDNKPGKKVIIVTFVCTFASFAIAQLGLNVLVAKGYKYLGYLTIPVIVIPYLIHMAYTKFDTKND